MVAIHSFSATHRRLREKFKELLPVANHPFIPARSVPSSLPKIPGSVRMHTSEILFATFFLFHFFIRICSSNSDGTTEIGSLSHSLIPMKYTKHLPSEQLRPYVDCFFIWESEKEEKILVQSPPSGYNGLVFNYADPYWAYQTEDQKEQVPLIFASGQFTANYHLEVNGKIGMIGAVLHPASLYNFFGFPMPELVNQRMDLAKVLGESIQATHRSLKGSCDPEKKVLILETFLETFLPAAKSKLSIIDEAIDFIHTKAGMVSIEEVLRQFSVSRRYLEKRFLEKVGISPKLYARIKRFSYLSNTVANREKIDWQDIVAANGFHDQSHLIKDYKTFNHMNPSDYHQKHRELIRYLDK